MAETRVDIAIACTLFALMAPACRGGSSGDGGQGPLRDAAADTEGGDGAASSKAPPSEPAPEPLEEETIAQGMAKVGDAVVREEPASDGRPIGVLRWGARFEVSDSRGSGESSWVRMKGVGWIKGTDVITRRKGPPKLGFVPVPPELGEAMPYRYARVTEKKGVPVYRRPPRRGEDPQRVFLRSFKEGYFFTVDRWVNIYDRQMYRTTRYWFVPRAGTTTVSGPTFEGVEVTEETELPFIWVTDPTALLCPETRHPEPDAGVGNCQRAERHERLPFVERRESGGVWYRTRGGRWIASTQVALVDRIDRRPSIVSAGERWIHVDLRNQVAALYEGDRMIFVTLVSSGDDDHVTPAGTYRVESKHVTTTMDNEDNLSGPYFIQDVPWVMYFRGSYGLHGAFWHDRFGLRTSHGCVNLSPRDARRFFEFAAAPALPEGWHAVYTPPTEQGTVIHITE